ncbi:MAG: hypothetical protein L6243_01910 [Candidatus Altiarchaeales archaeon]|nr:single-stranded DNA-specific exonuclease [Candidatus Altiarchaeota archaeon]MBU4266611.1 single-stranded DNA-specific exonuclease [Candidatus Altiarchaeota archaeon]MBU4406534.1 single-stranded DNA-specific exonuclease [Candidatus Altiarchaeota archaeon]MBU4437221.1 single-stranded DNA-specific exonuclease [Candidatus Altiarchaeota archaeon]MCG2782325.1 hypothetical protein [Candidatus Altiarchaeales archaeon]
MELFDSYSKGLIVHHWDTDGICSAGMLLSELKGKEVDNISPGIGNYYLTKGEIEIIKDRGYEFIAIVDVCIPKENILKLKNSVNSKIFIFDHHLQENIKEVEHMNPVSEGKSQESFPSTSWVLSQWVGVNLLAILGAVGDKEGWIKENELIYPEIEKFMGAHSVDFKQLLRMVKLIDSSHKVMDKEGVESAVRFVTENRNSPEKILGHQPWHQNSKRIRTEIDRQMSNEIIEDGNVLLLNILTPLNIISTITRKLAWKNPQKMVVVVNRGFFWNRNQIYVRGIKAQRLIKIARERGYSAGGKRGVAGVVLPNTKTDDFLSIVKNI